MNLMINSQIIIKNIEVFIENQQLIQTNLRIKVFRNLIQNLPFFSDLIIDIYFPNLNLNIFPSFIKVKILYYPVVQNF